MLKNFIVDVLGSATGLLLFMLIRLIFRKLGFTKSEEKR